MRQRAASQKPPKPEKNLSRRKLGPKVGFLEFRKVGQKKVKSRSKKGFSAKRTFFDLFLTYFPKFQKTYFWPILRLPAVFCAKIFGVLRKSAVLCGFLRPSNA